MRNSWIKSRIGRKNNTQMNFARNGEITEEMNFQVWGVVTFIIHKANASTSGL